MASEFDTVDELTADVRERLGRGKRLEQAAAARDAVLEALLEKVEIPLPETVVADELNARRQNIEQQLAYAGITMEKYLEDERQTVEEFEADLERRVRDAIAAQFLLDEVAKKEELGVDQDELSQHLVRRAQQSGQDPQEFANHMFEHNHIPELVQEILRGKALAAIVEAAVVKDASGNVVELKNLRPDGTIGEPEGWGGKGGGGWEGGEGGEGGLGGMGGDAGGELGNAWPSRRRDRWPAHVGPMAGPAAAPAARARRRGPDGAGRRRPLALTARGDVLRRDHPSGLRSVPLMQTWGPNLASPGAGWPTPCDRTGHLRGGQRRRLWEALSRDPEERPSSTRRWPDGGPGRPTDPGRLRPRRGRPVVDVGGGNGAPVAALLRGAGPARCRRRPPDVVPRRRRDPRDAGVADRCWAAAADFFVEVPSGGDAYVLSNILPTGPTRSASDPARVAAHGAGRPAVGAGKGLDPDPPRPSAAQAELHLLDLQCWCCSALASARPPSTPHCSPGQASTPLVHSPSPGFDVVEADPTALTA